MKTTMFITMALATASGVVAQMGCNENFPDLKSAPGLNSTAKDLATKCEATAKKVPSCAYKCLEDAGQSIGCNFWDFACQCSSSDSQSKVRQATIPCVIQSCPIPSALKVQSTALDICKCAGFATSPMSIMDLVAMAGLLPGAGGAMGGFMSGLNTSSTK